MIRLTEWTIRLAGVSDNCMRYAWRKSRVSDIHTALVSWLITYSQLYKFSVVTVLWMTNFLPSGPNGVPTKSNGPLKYPHLEMCGLNVAWIRRLRVSSVWTRSWSHIYFGKYVSMLARTDKKCALNVRMARLTTFLQCTLGGNNWNFDCQSSVITLLYLELTSLSSTCT